MCLPVFFAVLFCAGPVVAAGAEGAAGAGSGAGAVAVSASNPVVAKDRMTEIKIRYFFMVVCVTRENRSSYTVDKKRCNLACVRSRPSTRKMLVMLGPAFVPDTASRATAW